LLVVVKMLLVHIFGLGETLSSTLVWE
jgi:hypothetical protein